jgi:hypothetical protein
MRPLDRFSFCFCFELVYANLVYLSRWYMHVACLYCFLKLLFVLVALGLEIGGWEGSTMCCEWGQERNYRLKANKCWCGWKSSKVYHIWPKMPNPYYNSFLPFILIPIKNNESKLVKIFKRIIFKTITIIDFIMIIHKCVFTW